jgi:hypothetical protein
VARSLSPRAFPYEDLWQENGRRGKWDAEYELLDTGVFDGDRYWTVEPGASVELRLRLRPQGAAPDAAGALGRGFDEVMWRRKAETDEFYAELTPAAASADEANVMRQAFAGMLWSKQFYYLDVARWLDGDPLQPPPPASRTSG